jgi:hypothetical protein
MTFTFGMSRRFLAELPSESKEKQDSVDDFIELYELSGLADHTKFPGRLSPSWHTLPTNHKNYEYAQKHSLWHYHCGFPHYTSAKSWGNTSEYLIHFQWVGQGSHIDIVDLYEHYRYGGEFYIPTVERLVLKPVAAGGAAATPVEHPAAPDEQRG